MIVSLLIASASAFGLVVVSMFLVHVVCSSYLLRSEPPLLEPGDPETFDWHVVVPAMNEEAVLEASVCRLLAMRPQPCVWIVDDASTDATPDIADALAEAHDNVRVIHRHKPDAQTGKGHALNHAYRALIAERATIAGQWAGACSPMRVIVGIVDADGTLDPATLDVLSGSHCFGDPSVGAVQQDVWMSNADNPAPLPGRGRRMNRLGATMLRLQDIEFRSSIAAIQHTRHYTRSVAMGGNGQWTRLEALDDIVRLDPTPESVNPGPWHGALLEDFELGLHLLMTGWVSRFTPGCAVSQEALPSLSRYLRQRTRWCQGSMQCVRYLPRLWRSTFVRPSALLEIVYYLFQPWLWIVGTFLFPIPLWDVLRAFFRNPGAWMHWVADDSGWMFLLLFWGLALGPLASWAFTYRTLRGAAGELKPTRRRTLHDGLAYVVLVNFSYVIAWNALRKLVRKQNTWVKTTRNPSMSRVPGVVPVDIS